METSHSALECEIEMTIIDIYSTHLKQNETCSRLNELNVHART